MFRKLLLITVTPITFTFAATLSELLDSVQTTLSQYESDGRAVEKPYVYNKMLNYYRYGKLYASYALYKPATEMLNMAACAAAPFDCSPYKYFVRAIHPQNYYFLRKNYPILTARLETAYNAYAEWWIKKYRGIEEYNEFKNLESILRSDFLTVWGDFLKVAKRPIYFQINKKLTDADRFLLEVLKFSCRQGLIKRLVFYGDKGDFIELLHRGLLSYSVIYKPYNCPYTDFLVAY